MAPLASVFTPSFNKPGYVTEAVASVLAQDFTDFEYWILENSTDGGQTRAALAPLLGDPRVICEEISLTPEERAAAYPAALLLNRYYPKANGKYIFYLSDDDLLAPDCLRRCVEFLEADGSRQVCYFSLQHTAGGTVTGGIPAALPRGAGTGEGVDCRIDGGQIAHRKDCLDQIPPPWFPETAAADTARHCDGLFMEKLAERFTFHPLPYVLATHRRTPLSVWDRP